MRNKTVNTTQCYIHARGKTLFLHRTKKKNDPLRGKWVAVGGKLEPGETPTECARREVKEETGLTLNKLRFRGLITFAVKSREKDIDTCHAFIFECSSFKGGIIDSSEGNLAWVTDKQILRLNILDKDRIFLPWIYGNNKIFFAKFELEEDRLVSHGVDFYGTTKV